MTYWQRLARVEMRGQLALLLLALVVSLTLFVAILAGFDGYWSMTLVDVRNIGLIFALTYLIGLAPVAIYGAPIYALIAQRWGAGWAAAGIIGAAPGFILLLASALVSNHDIVALLLLWGVIALLAGTAVAATTHALVRGDM
jgi:hypothetical protein